MISPAAPGGSESIVAADVDINEILLRPAVQEL
jgi:hypothetical protein